MRSSNKKSLLFLSLSALFALAFVPGVGLWLDYFIEQNKIDAFLLLLPLHQVVRLAELRNCSNSIDIGSNRKREK